MREILLEPYDGTEDWHYAFVDDRDYEHVKDFPWTDDQTFDNQGRPLRVSQVFCVLNDGKHFLHREIWELHEDEVGPIEGKNVAWLDSNPRRAYLKNLFAWEPGPKARKQARMARLRELHEQGVDVSHLTTMFQKKGWQKKFENVYKPLSAPPARSTTDPEVFDIPEGAPEGIRAIRTVNGTLVYVEAARYNELARYDWYDTGKRVVRGQHPDRVTLAQLVLGSDPLLLVGYLDFCHLHCWKSNLFAYEKGLANRRAARRAAIAALEGASDDQQ